MKCSASFLMVENLVNLDGGDVIDFDEVD